MKRIERSRTEMARPRRRTENRSDPADSPASGAGIAAGARAFQGAALLAVSLFVLAGCPGPDDASDALPGLDPEALDTVPADTVPDGPAVGWSGRPPVRAAPGLGEEGTTLILFETTEEFPVAFSTYFPEDLGVDLIRSGEGVAARFAGEMEEAGGRIVVLAFFPTEEIASEDVRSWVREVAEARGPDGVQRADPPRRPWADLEYRFRSDEAPAARGTISLSRWDDRYFYIAVQAPAGREEEVEAWVEPILSRWEWEDGTPLISDEDS